MHGANKTLKDLNGETAVDLAKTEEIKELINSCVFINGR